MSFAQAHRKLSGLGGSQPPSFIGIEKRTKVEAEIHNPPPIFEASAASAIFKA